MILAKKSALELLDFSIIESQYKFVPPTDENSNVDIEDTFQKYDVYIDYAFRSQNEKRVGLQIRVLVNPEEDDDDNTLVGYRLLIEGAAIFKLKEEGRSDEELRNLINFSSVNILVSTIRGYIANLTAYAPFGRYMLPTIDVPSLINEKAKHWEEHRARQGTADMQ